MDINSHERDICCTTSRGKRLTIEFNETAERSDAGPSLAKGFTSSGVDNHIDTSTISTLHESFGKETIANGENVVIWNAKLFDDECLLFGTFNCNEYLSSDHLSDSKICLSQGACSRVDQ